MFIQFRSLHAGRADLSQQSPTLTTRRPPVRRSWTGCAGDCCRAGAERQPARLASIHPGQVASRRQERAVDRQAAPGASFTSDQQRRIAQANVAYDVPDVHAAVRLE